MNNYIFLLPCHIFLSGVYIILCSEKALFKRIIGLSIAQNSAIIFFLALGKVNEGKCPIVLKGAAAELYSSPLPQVLMLTAIVVGFATLATALALIKYGKLDLK